MDPFYLGVLRKEIKQGTISTQDSVLVICGGPLDASTLMTAGFTKVVISNLNPRIEEDAVKPFQWSYQDAENLTYEDNTFDIVIVHSGLHHCYNPWKALGEMCRVARKVVIAYEPYDSLFTRVGAKLGYGQEYETAAVYYNNCDHGGVANTEIPNYVTRFRPQEVRKFACSMFPHGRPQLRFYKALRINTELISNLRNPFLKYSLLPIAKILTHLSRYFSVLANNVAMVIQPPESEHLHSWVKMEGETPRVIPEELAKLYKKR